MNKSAIFTFIAGAALGSGATWYFMKKQCNQRIQEEVDSVKAVFTVPKVPVYEGPNDSDEEKKMEEKHSAIEDKPDVVEYARKLSQSGYTNYSKPDISEEEDEEEEILPPPADVNNDPQDKPYVISPDEFGEFDDYGTISLTYYADGILTDDADEPIEDVEGVVGAESLNHFGDYEDDSVFVRNDRLKSDYEILLDQRRYSDVAKTNLHRDEED